MLLAVLATALVANLLFAVTFGAQEAHACSCGMGTPEERLQGSDAVFSGVVVDVDKGYAVESDVKGGTLSSLLARGSLAPVTFDVEESWKGVSEGPVAVRGYGSGVSCDIEFRGGERYLVYADSKQEEDVPLGTGLCAGTKRLDQARRDLQALGPSKSDIGNIAVVSSVALLFVATLDALTYWRWRHPG